MSFPRKVKFLESMYYYHQPCVDIIDEAYSLQK